MEWFDGELAAGRSESEALAAMQRGALRDAATGHPFYRAGVGLRSEQSGRHRPYHGAMSDVATYGRGAIAVAVFGMLGWLGGCSDSPSGPDSRFAVVISPGSATLKVQETLQLAATVRDSVGNVIPGRSVTWVSDNVSVATVSHAGLVTGVAIGSAAVIATSEGKSDTAAIIVTAPPPDGLVVSDPSPLSVVAARAVGALALASGAGDSVVYVSLSPGTAPAGTVATIRRVGDAGSVITAVRDGGFDPITVAAQAGDSIDVVVLDAGGSTVFEQRVAVRASRPPVVVRTDPPRDKTDVPVNASIIVVFSEPMDGVTLNPSSLGLFRGTSAVSGTVRLFDASATAAVFVPDIQLDLNTTYQLVVTDAVRDRDGQVLATPVTVAFTTGASLVGQPASIELSPDSILNLFIGFTYDISVTVRDAVGNVLTGQPLAWSSSDPSVATVLYPLGSVPPDSIHGRVTGVSTGSVKINVTSGALRATAFVTIASRDAPAGVAALTLFPDSLTLAALDGWRMRVRLWDANGREMVEPPGATRFVVTLVSGNLIVRRPATITSDYCGSSFPFGYSFCPGWNEVWVQPVAEGSATLIAASEGVSDTAVITVVRRREVAAVKVVPSQWTMRPHDTLRLRAHLLDADGKEITWLNGGPRPISWTVDNPAAIVDTIPRSCYEDSNGGLEPWAPTELGRITYACAAELRAIDTGLAAVTVQTEAQSTTATIAVPRLTFASVTAGGHRDIWHLNDFIGHSCGITSNSVTVCWGGDRGAVGGEWFHNSVVPWALSGARAFTSLSAGELFTCGLTVAGDAYCWGSSIYLDNWWEYWELGRTDEPSLVPGGHTYISLDAGARSTCGLTTTGAAYCWNWSSGNQPLAVSSSHDFVSLSVGDAHACALSLEGTAYCWGANANGQIGDGSLVDRSTPVPVAGGQTFVALDAGITHTCGLVAVGDVYCWGDNSQGQLGNGSGGDRAVPTLVSGGLRFVALSQGGAAATTCALTAAGVAYCWGHNAWGQVGDGTTTDRFAPSPVAGGLTFASVSTGERHTCAVTPAAVAYCWGWNGAGQLGDGESYGWSPPPDSSVPVRVAGQP